MSDQIRVIPLGGYREVSKKIKEGLGRFIYEKTRLKPMIMPVVLEV